MKGARPVAAAGLIAATILLAGSFSLRAPLVNPSNEGLVEFLRDALRTDRRDDAIAALGMMGPAAAPAIPALEALSVEEKASVVTRAAAAEALARIRPDPTDAGKLVQ